MRVTGWWTLDAPDDWTPPPALAQFLAAGSPPVFAGFGSMTPHDASGLTRTVLDSVGHVGARVVLQRGWGGLGDGPLPPWACVIDDVPHAWLFPRMAAIVHHCGAGTTGTALRAGVPSVPVPVFADQPFWGERIRALGVGPRPIMRSALDVGQLTHALRRVLGDAAMQERAARLGALLAAEDGVAAAVAVVDRLAGRRGRDSSHREPSVA